MVAASHHEASVAHATDRGGHSVHAPGLVGAHTSHDSDFHAAAPSPLDADCDIVAALHASVDAPAAFALPVASVEALAARAVVAHTAAHAQLYLIAPKTSPPNRA